MLVLETKFKEILPYWKHSLLSKFVKVQIIHNLSKFLSFSRVKAGKLPDIEGAEALIPKDRKPNILELNMNVGNRKDNTLSELFF